MHLRFALLACVVGLGCTGELSGVLPVSHRDELPPDPQRPPVFECRPEAEPAPEVVQRLTPTQYRNVLRDVLGRGLPGGDLDALFASAPVRTQLERLPVDGSALRTHITYDSMDQRISTLLVEPQFELATAVGDFVEASPARLEHFVRTFVPGCAGSAACVDDFIVGFGAKALRRPLDDDDRGHYRGVFDDAQYGGYRALIAAFLLAPDFLFRTEFHGAPVDGREDLVAVTPFELANRLSFSLTNSMPDDALFAAAEAGFEGDGLTVEAQVARLSTSAEAEHQLEHFFRQWLRQDRLPPFNDSALETLALSEPGSSLTPLPTSVDLAQLRTDAFEESVELLTTAARHGSLRDALTSDVSYARSPALAQLYGVPVWNGDEGQLIHFPAGERAGLFTRAAYLFSGYPDPNIVMRGARLRVEYLCDELEPPADTSAPPEATLPEVPTVRNFVASKTEVPNTACQSCHAQLINPLGFALDDFDAVGRKRRQEPLFTPAGAIERWEPINATSRPDVDRAGDTETLTGGVALSHRLAQSRKLTACFARHAFRYVKGRTEALDHQEDACVLDRVERAAGTSSLKDVLAALSTGRQLTLRRLSVETAP